MYKVETTTKFRKGLNKLDPYIRKMIIAWIRKNLVDCDNPRIQGKSLKGEFEGLWRYRIGDYRIICEIEDEKLVILAIAVGHRNSIYLHESNEE